MRIMKHINQHMLIAAMFLLARNASGESLVFPPYMHSYGIRKATPAKLFLFFGLKTCFDDPQGIATVKMKSRDDTSTTKDDDEVVVYGVNSGRSELIYNTSMWGLARYGTRGSGSGQFLNPKGIAIDADGNVYVADCGNNRIVHLFNPGKTVDWVGVFGIKTTSGPGLSGPSQISLDAEGEVYVSDPGNHRIAVYKPSGNLCRTILGPADAPFENGPSMLTIADGKQRWSYFSGERALYCADAQGTRLLKMDLNGAIIVRASMPSGHKAFYAATDYFHNVWVTDKENNCIVKFDKDLRLLDVFGSRGDDKNQFQEPRGIAIWQRFGQVFIAEKKGAQYFWVGTDLKSKELIDKGNSRYVLNVNVTEYSFISLFETAGRDTSWLISKRLVFPGGASINFSDVKKTVFPSASMVLKTEPTYSSYLYNSWTYPMSLNR
jgi:DNA-binding beta-propeller fold protein YncE